MASKKTTLQGESSIKTQMQLPGSTMGAPPATERPVIQARSICTHLSLVLLAVILANLLHFATWAMQILWPIKLPDHWVSGNVGNVECSQYYATSSDRSSYFGKPTTGIASATQELNFCEDAELLDGKWEGWSLYSCDYNRGNWNTVIGPLKNAAPRGALWLWNHANASVTGAAPKALELLGYPDDASFHPLGFSLHLESDVLFVVNHGKFRSSVEVFRVTAAPAPKLQYLRTIVHSSALHTPNSVLSLSPTSFLVSNDHFIARRPPPFEAILETYRSRLGLDSLSIALAHFVSIPKIAGLLAKVETMLGMRGGWVDEVHFDGDVTRTRRVASNIPFANGVALSPDGKTLAVAATTAPGVRLYDLNQVAVPRDGFRLPQLGDAEGNDFETIPLRFPPDNLAFVPSIGPMDPSSPVRLIASGHPNPLKLLTRAKDPYSGKAHPAPSWVVVINVLPPRTIEPKRTTLASGSLPVAPTRPRFEKSQNRKRSSPRFLVRTLYQSNGRGTSEQEGSTTGASSSTAALFDEDAGLLVVTGLYSAGLLVCRNVHLPLLS